MARAGRGGSFILCVVALHVALSVCSAPLGAADTPGPSVESDLAREILKATAVQGGLVVHPGCGDGKLTAALRASDRYLVHGLATDADDVARAREHIRKLGLCGKVAVDTFDGEHLPYADNLVNLLVADEPGRLSAAEITRVLAPRGVAYVRRDGQWTKTVKPWPEELDEWTHSLHGPGGNPVAEDRAVGPPRHLRWTAGPLWARSHGWTPSVSAMVSAGGRLFCICDETLSCADGTVPARWALVARDAFSGVLLWKRPMLEWGSDVFSGTPGTGAGVSVGRFTMPPNVSKRLVAVGDTVYVTLGPTAPVSALDAATGVQKRVYAGTADADEILCTGKRLILSINPRKTAWPSRVDPDKTPPGAPGKDVCAVDVKTGRVLWKKGPFSGIRTSRGQDPWGRLELGAGDGKVFLLTAGAIQCLELESGETAWRIERPALPEGTVRRLGFAGMYEFLLAVMVYHDGVVLLAQPQPNTHHTYHTMPGTLYAFDAEDGRPMWEHAYGGWGHCTQPDVFVAGGVVWTHVNAETEFGSVWGKGYRARDPSQVDYRIQALDLRTGRPRKELSTREIFNVGHHHRCYRNRATERFLLSCRRGVEFVDLATGKNFQNHWVRSGCLLGYLPCNGLLYVTPHPCACYLNAKLVGFNALAPETKAESGGPKAGAPAVPSRLRRGPAYGKKALHPSSFIAHPSQDWPTYRHDPGRSGATESRLGPELSVAWQSEIGTAPGGLVVAGGKVLVAGAGDHTVHALRAEDGRPAWQYTTGGRVDSPPTFHAGLAIFGSADGRVYCLRAADGALVWRFDAAPHRRLVTALGQLESAWPVPGSVLIHDGKCWFAAGRSSYLDGGIRLYALDPATGKVLHSETIYSPDRETGKMLPETSAQSMPGLLNDIPATDGASVFIRQMAVSSSGAPHGPHLVSSGGYLDASWFNRTFWQAGRARTSGLMVLGRDVAYGVEVYSSRSRETLFTPGANAYRLAAIPLQAPAGGPRAKQAAGKRRAQGVKPLWQKRLAVRVTAMVRAAETIFVAGSPDVVDPKDPHGAWEGRKGGVLATYAADDGRKLAEHKLPAPPVWDGMAVAGGRLFISTGKGCIVCMGKRQ